MIRKHPELKPVCCQSLARTLRYVEEGSGKASIIWLLGECCDIVQDAPYALEKLIDDYDNLKDIRVKQNLLNATMKIFFARPPETQRMLGRLMIKVTDDVSSQDLHDRGLLYYRLLKSGADPKSIMAHVISNSKSTIPDGVFFTEEDDKELRAELMQEFDSLATVYGKTSVNFIKPEFQVMYKKMPLEHPLDAIGAPGPSVQVPVAPQNIPQPPIVDHAAVNQSTDNMIGDLLGFDTPSPVVAAPPPATTSPSPISWMIGATISGNDYQAKWGAISDADAIVETIALQSIPSSTGSIEAALFAIGVGTMASGEMPDEFKLFLYALEEGGDGNTVLIQSNISKGSEPLMILTIKVENSDGSASQNASEMINSLILLIKNAL